MSAVQNYICYHTVPNSQSKVILAICYQFLTHLRFACDELVEVVAVRGAVSDLIIPNIPVTLPEGLQGFFIDPYIVYTKCIIIQ